MTMWMWRHREEPVYSEAYNTFEEAYKHCLDRNGDDSAFEIVEFDTEQSPNYVLGHVAPLIRYRMGRPESTEYWTESEAGSVKFGNEHFTVRIPNGYGDGYTRVVVIDDVSYVNWACNKGVERMFGGSISGVFYLYSHDCRDEVKVELDGDYLITIGKKEIYLHRY